MKLYLVRHGDALAGAVDPARPLSARGRLEVERVAAWAGRKGVCVAEIRHSGKQRALETAQIVAGQIKPERGLREVSGLSPNDDVRPVADSLDVEVEDVMLVGHLPFMGLLASLLTLGDADRGIVAFPTGGLAVLERGGESWSLIESVDPRRLG